MDKQLRSLTIIVLILFLSSCDKLSLDQKNRPGINISQITLDPKENSQRWYFSDQVERGKVVFSNHCAACHGKNAEATSSWKTPDANFNYPPPPLNGSAHAWHHPLSVLASTIYNGGAPVGGQMPSFRGKLSETEVIDVIAYFQSYWLDDIYNRWLEIEKSSREQ